MMLKIGVQYALRHILRTPLRSLLVLLGIALTISLYTIVDGVGDSFSRQITSLLGRQNADIIVQSKYASSPLSSRILADKANAIIHMDEVADYGALAIGKMHIKKNVNGFVIGVTDIEKFAYRLGLSMTEGRMARDTREVIVAKQLAKVLKLGVGDMLDLSVEKSFKIVGLYETWIGFFNSSLICEMKEAQVILHINDNISMLALALQKPYQAGEIIEKINTDYPRLQAIRSSDFSSSMGPLKALFIIMHIISLVTLMITLGILFNTFMITVNERSREIAILMATGWSEIMVVLVLMFESVLLALMGGVVGFLLSFPVLYFLKQHYQSIYVYMPSSLGWDALENVLLICLGIGILSILFPAFYAVKKNIARELHGR